MVEDLAGWVGTTISNTAPQGAGDKGFLSDLKYSSVWPLCLKQPQAEGVAQWWSPGLER